MKLATIFKMDFALSNLTHSAVISICGDANDSFIHIQLINSFFKKVFGVEHIRFRNQNGQLQLEESKFPFIRQIAMLVSNHVDKELKTFYSVNALRAI